MVVILRGQAHQRRRSFDLYRRYGRLSISSSLIANSTLPRSDTVFVEWKTRDEKEKVRYSVFGRHCCKWSECDLHLYYFHTLIQTNCTTKNSELIFIISDYQPFMHKAIYLHKKLFTLSRFNDCLKGWNCLMIW